MSVQLLGKRELKRLASVANDGAGAGYTSFAKGMMAKMGWAEGEGLGKDNQGRATYVQVKKKDDNSGLGKEKAQQNNVNDQWYFDAFDSALANMGGKKKRKDKKKKKKSKSGAGDQAEEQGECMYDKMFKATGGARMGMRARASQNGKLARTEGDHNAAGSDITTGTTNGTLETTSHKRKRDPTTSTHAGEPPASAGVVKVKQEKTPSTEKRRDGEGGTEGDAGASCSSKADRKLERSEAKKAKRADKAVKVEKRLDSDVNCEKAEGESAQGEEKTRKKKKKKRAEKEG